jgi:hypothetical protein
MSDTCARPRAVMAVGFPSILTSWLLAQANQDLFGLSSDFLAGFFLAVGIAVFASGLAAAIRSRRADSH